jgi:hypothetical protein
VLTALTSSAPVPGGRRSTTLSAGRRVEGDALVEEALRRGLGLDLLERLWAKNDSGEAVAMALAVEARLAARSERR